MREVGGVKLLARAVEGIEIKDLKSLADDGKKQLGSGVVAIVGVTEDGKAGVVVGVTADLTARFNAVDLVRMGSEALGGKGGGGRPDMAQAGGPDGAKADAALAAIEKAMAAARLPELSGQLAQPSVERQPGLRRNFAHSPRSRARSGCAGLVAGARRAWPPTVLIRCTVVTRREHAAAAWAMTSSLSQAMSFGGCTRRVAGGLAVTALPSTCSQFGPA